MVLESIAEETAKAILEGILALITPVMTSTDGRCVAMIKWIPAGLSVLMKEANQERY